MNSTAVRAELVEGSKPRLNSSQRPSRPGRVSPRRARHLFFASPKKSTQKKGDPQSGPLRGSLRCSKGTEILETCRLRRLRTSKIFIRPLLRCSAQPERVWGKRNRNRGAERAKRVQRSLAVGIGCLYSFPLPSVCAEERRSRRIRARDCLSAASSRETPAGPSTAGCP